MQDNLQQSLERLSLSPRHRKKVNGFSYKSPDSWCQYLENKKTNLDITNDRDILSAPAQESPKLYKRQASPKLFKRQASEEEEISEITEKKEARYLSTSKSPHFCLKQSSDKDNKEEEILEIISDKKTVSPLISKVPVIKRVYRKSLTLTQEPAEEVKIEKPIRSTKHQTSNHKRKIDPLHRSDMKQIKTEMTSSPESATKVHLNFHPYRNYPERVKVKAMEFAKTYGVAKVSIETGIPETTLRRWQTVGIERIGASGRKPQFPRVEKELLAFFKAERDKGNQLTNHVLLKQARKIAEAQKEQSFSGSPAWLEGFKRRARINYRKSTKVGQRPDPDAESLVNDFQDRFIQLLEIHNYPKDAIVNADETGIWYDSPSHYTLDFRVMLSHYNLFTQ